MNYELRMILDNDCCITYMNIKRLVFTSNYVYMWFIDGEERTIDLEYPNGKKRFKHFKVVIKEDK